MKVTSAAPTWFGSTIFRPRSEVGYILCPGAALLDARARNQRLDPHHPHQPPHPLAVDPTAFLVEFRRSFAASRRTEVRDAQFVDAAHHRQIVRLGDVGPGR